MLTSTIILTNVNSESHMIHFASEIGKNMIKDKVEKASVCAGPTT